MSTLSRLDTMRGYGVISEPSDRGGSTTEVGTESRQIGSQNRPQPSLLGRGIQKIKDGIVNNPWTVGFIFLTVALVAIVVASFFTGFIPLVVAGILALTVMSGYGLNLSIVKIGNMVIERLAIQAENQALREGLRGVRRLWGSP